MAKAMKLSASKLIFLLGCTFIFALSGRPQNLLLNPNADSGSDHWGVSGSAAVEEFSGRKVFVVRNGGSFFQEVTLSDSDVERYTLLIGFGSSERINADGAITGLPYLYGYMLNPNRREGSIQAYLQGQKMLATPSKLDDWTAMYGIFPVPKGTRSICFFLNQAERKHVPQNGSAARFDNVGVYLFETEQDALDFARAYTQ
ncbi:MAG: hypothetical protein HOP17_08565 [Acidobacteria bacterium]|nr:hypothetical protein [Acidobacteriota bacterium]